jgi:hypothetical protein
MVVDQGLDVVVADLGGPFWVVRLPAGPCARQPPPSGVIGSNSHSRDYRAAGQHPRHGAGRHPYLGVDPVRTATGIGPDGHDAVLNLNCGSGRAGVRGRWTGRPALRRHRRRTG